MPLYEYKCEVCEKEEEVFAWPDDPPPVCHEKPMTKLISSFFIRKGGGLYSIDKPEAKPWGDWEE